MTVPSHSLSMLGLRAGYDIEPFFTPEGEAMVGWGPTDQTVETPAGIFPVGLLFRIPLATGHDDEIPPHGSFATTGASRRVAASEKGGPSISDTLLGGRRPPAMSVGREPFPC